MSVYKFKLPDIGEGIAEAEIVAWHVKLGDMIEEDQQLADMMTDKATVEMESPVAGKVIKLAGDVGDQIAIGSVLVEIETASSEGAVESKDEQPLGDGAVKATAAQEKQIPVSATAPQPPPARAGGEEREARRGGPVESEDKPSPSPSHSGGRGAEKTLASPAVRQRARDLGIDLALVKTTADRIRHSDLDAYLLYNGGNVSHGAAATRADETIKVVGLTARSPRICRRPSAASRISRWSKNSTSPTSRIRGR